MYEQYSRVAYTKTSEQTTHFKDYEIDAGLTNFLYRTSAIFLFSYKNQLGKFNYQIHFLHLLNIVRIKLLKKAQISNWVK